MSSLAAWSPDGLHIVSASNDGTVRIWNADGTGEPIVLRPLNKENANSASWSPDGKSIVAAVGKTLVVWSDLDRCLRLVREARTTPPAK